MELVTRTSPLTLGILSTLATAALFTYVAWSVDLFSWEVGFTQWVQGFTLGKAHFLRGWIFWMGIRGVAGAVMVLAFGALWLKRQRLEAISLGLISIPDLFIIWLRELIGRPRPTADLVDVLLGYGGAQGPGFPSGHALHVVLFYGFLIYLATLYISKRSLIRAIWALGTVYILVSGLWLVYDGRHWFTDVIGGYVYGGFYLLVLIAAYRWAGERVRRNEHLQLSRMLTRPLKRPAEYLLRLVG
jgi:membrane-associated phospholipid phosphatase